MHKSLLISMVSEIVLMSAGNAFAADEENPWDSFKAAVEAGGTVTLDKDLTVSAGGAITTYPSGTVIDGNGHTISAPVSAEGTESADFRFINNSTTADTPLGIKNITFKGGHIISSSSSEAYGGAIYNYAEDGTTKIGDIIGSMIDGRQIAFKGNYAQATGTGSYSYAYANGGAIYNYAYHSIATAKIGNIYGDFTNNHAVGSDSVWGGAILNYANSPTATATIGDIHGNFEGNYAKSIDSFATGGAILSYENNPTATATIGNIYGNFTNNYAKGLSEADGGAIVNGGIIGDITGDFIGNYAESTSSQASGGR